ncbi:MAG: retroviral-like aspartic protease family protein [Pegethrix bostrychoides GSE-TBD4-15B]|uniref:Retroviral-like aspartic protease family protein n=1 Tax=Pegethrix bostrychoides GSE-TBD4-15B TaxID=2839662 RepID=A0A951U746_9CYAN|nr:retroviral-like aspartic protease family protein [Pegethrix bostrychoides GSE-TBD4-15B]
MPKPCSFNLATMLIVGLALWTSACASSSPQSSDPPSPTVAEAPQTPVSLQASPQAASQKATASQSDSFQLAIARATSAFKIGQSAQSRDDWRLVANRWQQAITLMKAVPASNPNRAKAQQKLIQYQQNLAYAQRQANRPTDSINPNGVVVLPPFPVAPSPPLAAPPRPRSPMAAAAPQAAPKLIPPALSRGFYAPIVRRAGNTPVIRVMFNNQQPFDMILDTGASGTLITRKMASQLGVVPVAQASVDTASQRNVTFPLGYVQSIEVGGAIANNVLVAVAGPELSVGLLGHDFFGNYDVIIRENQVEFQERS